MIAIEIALVIIFTLLSGVMYMMYKFFDERIDELHEMISFQEENSRFGLECTKEALNNRIYLLEQILKDSSQATALCSKSGIEQSNTFCSRLEVRIKRLEEKLASAGKKESKPKPTFNVSLSSKSKKDSND